MAAEAVPRLYPPLLHPRQLGWSQEVRFRVFIALVKGFVITFVQESLVEAG